MVAKKNEEKKTKSTPPLPVSNLGPASAGPVALTTRPANWASKKFDTCGARRKMVYIYMMMIFHPCLFFVI